jgi:flagellin
VLGGVYAVGDVISAQIGDKSYNYTVTEANVVTGSPSDAVKLDRIGVSLAALINGNRPTGMTAAAGADTAAETITITGTADTAQVPVAASASGLLGGINASVITNQSTSNAAIAALDTAIAVVNTGRSEMGAVMNRLQYASDNLSTISANATESRGRILDTDYAKETTELARTQIIAQAGTAMLAQANQMKQTVLSLLK